MAHVSTTWKEGNYLHIPLIQTLVHDSCRGTILMVQSLSDKSWPKKSHTMNFFLEYGLKNLVSVSLDGLLHGLRKYRNKSEKDGREERSLSNDQSPNFIHRHIFIQ